MENVEKKPKSTKNTNAKDVEKKVSTSKASKANATTQERAVKSNASKQSASKRGAKTEPKQTDEVAKGQEVAVDTANVERNSSSDDFSIQSQGERIKKNAGKNSKRKKAAIATAVVLLVTASVAIPTAVYLSRRKVSVDISNNIDIIQEYTINVNRGSTIKDIVPQEIAGYTFVGFYKDAELTVPYKDTDKINKNMTIYAKYEANVYKVTFPTSPAFTIAGEDIVNNQVEIEYNTEYRFKLNLATGYDESDITVKVNGEIVTPDQDGYYTLTIYGDTLVEVEGVEINTYEVTFYDSLEKNEMYQNLDIQYNQLCTYTGITPTKHSTHTYTYTFIGWVDAEGNEVDLSTTHIVSDLELFANFREEYIEYTISKPEQVNVKFGDLYLSNTATLHYGDIVEITYDTTEGHDVTAFSVSGAEKVEGGENQYKITGNLVVTYTEEIQTFTVQIVSNNSEYGSINQSSITVEYGTTYTVEGNVLRFSDGQTVTATPETNTAQYTYTFLDWTSESGTVTGEATITANFTRETNTYTVSIQSNNTGYGTVDKSSITIEYGTEITVSGNTITIGDTKITATPSIDTAQYSYSFASWSTGDTTVTGAMLITATFSRETNTYTVTWKNYDGSTLETDTSVPYGTTPEYNGETPTREETASHRYTFTGWDQELNPVTGDITYTAIFDSEIKASYDFTIEDGIITSYTGNDTNVVLPSTYSLADMVETRSATLTYEEISSFDGSDFANAPMAYRLMCLGGFYCTINGGERTFYKNMFEFTEAMNTLDPDWSTNESLFPIQIDGATYEIALNGTDDGQEAIGYAFQSIPIAMMMAEGLGKPFNIIFDDGTTLENQTSYEHAYTQMMTIMEQKVAELTAQNPDITEEELMDQIYRFKFTTTPYRTGTVVAGDDFEVTGIADGVFANSDIETIRISENIATIGTGILSGCSNLKEIIFSATNCETTLNSFIGLSNSVTITVTSNVRRIPSYFLVEVSNDGNGTTSDELMTPLGLIDLDLKIEDGIVYDSIGHYGFYGKTDLTNINFSDQATYIGAYAFSGCTNLAEINLPSTIAYIGNYAFEGTAISTITIPENVITLGDCLFLGCTNLMQVIYAATNANGFLSTREHRPETTPFSYINPAVTITIADNVEYIPSGFLVTGSEGYNPQTIYAQHTISISNLIIGENSQLKEIGDYAFSGYTALTDITLPASLTSIGTGAFKYCTNLVDVHFQGNINDWASISCGGYANDGTSNPLYYGANLYVNGNELVTEANINTATSIGTKAFCWYDNLTSVTIGDQVTSIGENAFSGCHSLVYVVNKSSLEFNVGSYGTSTSNNSILEIVSDESEMNLIEIDGNLYKDYNGERYFIRNLDGSSEIEIDSSCTQIYQYAFYREDITSMTIPDGVTSIGERAFSSCTNLTSITIGEGVTNIGTYAFNSCTALTEINFNATNMSDLSSDNYVFYRAGQDGEGITVNIGANVTRIPAYLFCPYTSYSGCTPKITTVIFADNSQCIKMRAHAFYDCEDLTDVYYSGDINGWASISFDDGTANPLYYGANLYINGNELVTEANINTATSIGIGAFYNYDKLTSITIGDQVTSIGENAFSGCNSLVYIVNKSSLEFNVIDYGTSKYNNPILEIVSDESQTNLIEINGNLYKDYNGERYFIMNLDGSTEITIDSSCTQIYQYSFCGRADITSVTIPDSVTSIGSYAFDGCSSLTSITIPESVTSIGAGAFYGCSSLTSVTIGEGVTSIGGYAFEYCTSLTSITIPSSVTHIGLDAFQYCYITDVYYLGDINDWVSITFSYMWTDYYANPLCYGANLYINNELVTEVNIDTATSIGIGAFYNYDKLTSITIGDQVTGIGGYAFAYCDSLTSITIPSSVTRIGSYAFSGCSSLTSVTIESNNIYVNAGTNDYSGNLLAHATEVRVLISCIEEGSTNSYLENASNFTKTTSEDGLYYIYTKI